MAEFRLLAHARADKTQEFTTARTREVVDCVREHRVLEEIPREVAPQHGHEDADDAADTDGQSARGYARSIPHASATRDTGLQRPPSTGAVRRNGCAQAKAHRATCPETKASPAKETQKDGSPPAENWPKLCAARSCARAHGVI